MLIEASYCADSGGIVTGACLKDPRKGRIRTGYFTEDTLPDKYCDRHISVKYCEEGKGIAGEFCDAECVTYIGMLLYRRSMPYDITVRDSEYLFIDTDDANITKNIFLPFYQSEIKSGEYVGKSESVYPFNRFCTKHTAGVKKN